MVKLKVNHQDYAVEVSPDMPLLWVLRETLQLTGTKYGCGMALCGACTVHLDGEAVRSCITPVSRVVGKEVTTIRRGRTRPQPSTAAGLDRRGRAAVRLLSVRAAYGRRCVAARKSTSHRRRHR